MTFCMVLGVQRDQALGHALCPLLQDSSPQRPGCWQGGTGRLLIGFSQALTVFLPEERRYPWCHLACLSSTIIAWDLGAFCVQSPLFKTPVTMVSVVPAVVAVVVAVAEAVAAVVVTAVVSLTGSISHPKPR